MSPRRRGRVDANQKAIVEALRAVGATVTSLANEGKGVPDIVVGHAGKNYLLEIKDGSKPPSARKLTPDQVAWHTGWQGQVAVVESVADAVAFLVAQAQSEYDPPRISPTDLPKGKR